MNNQLNLNQQAIAPLTWTIMAAILLWSIISFFNKAFFNKMILHPYSIVRSKEYYRIFSGELVHNELIHLIINEVMLFFVCGNLEKNIRMRTGGSLAYLVIYMVSLFTGVSYIIFKYRKDFQYSTTGASGSILGCMMSYMILQPNKVAFYLPVIGGIKNKYDSLIYIVALIWYQRKKSDLTTNHEIHFFGAIGGIVATLVLFPGVW